MDDNKNNYGRENNFNRDNEPSPEREWDSNSSSNNNESTESGSSYYYSYGPFKSLNKDEMNPDDPQHYSRREPEHVEVTPPQPVRPVPYSTSIRTTGFDGNGGRGGSGGNGADGGNGWQYNHKREEAGKSGAALFSGRYGGSLRFHVHGRSRQLVHGGPGYYGNCIEHCGEDG